MIKKWNTFLCDEMCAEVGRWLRAAGYDTEIVDKPIPDEQVLQKALDEQRLLLSRDKYFKDKEALYLKSDSLNDQAAQLKEADVNWLFRPFSRCLDCNAPFKQESKDSWSCPKCGKSFWLGSHTENMEHQLEKWQDVLKVGFGGDTMIGRLVNEYLDEVPPSYIWGDLLPLLKSADLNLINLEAALTQSENRVLKVFNFKADPQKVAVLKEGNIHLVNIANNHILDFSEEGLLETLKVLDKAKIPHVGAGVDATGAESACILEKKGIRIGFIGCTDNEPGWKAGSNKPGTFYVKIGDLDVIGQRIASLRPHVDLLIVSIHWGPNMRERPTAQFRNFAHALIDLGVDILHGHSAHIFQGVELYKGKLILYDTGDFVDDYAIDPRLRNDLSFYFLLKAEKGRLISLKMIPTRISHFQVNICHDTASLDRMEKLCQELKTYPIREGNSLKLCIS